MKTASVFLLSLCLAVVALAAGPDLDAPAPDGLRKGGTLHKNLPAPPIAGDPSGTKREVRNWPEQPPVIPHSIRGYQVDKRVNQCLTCHSRTAAPESGAPMVSVTHFTDREGRVRAAVTPRRYFCTQCHVPQTDAAALVDSDFIPVDEVIRRGREAGQ
jgi:cytochrome c-type protein NapB